MSWRAWWCGQARHRAQQGTTSADALQLHNEYVDLKPDGMTKKKIMMVELIAENYERFGHAITPQRRRGALPKAAQGGGLRLVHVSPICKLAPRGAWLRQKSCQEISCTVVALLI